MDSSRAILAIERIVASGLSGVWRPYSSRLGSSDSTWTSTGIFKSQIEGDGRIVLEALTLVSFDGVVVRVYQEDPLVIHYAKRASTQLRIDTITKEAAAVFESLPGHLDEEITEDFEAFGTELIGVDIRELLNPLPPPFLIEATTDAEQCG